MNCVGDVVHALIGHNVKISTEMQGCYVASMLRHKIELMEMIKMEPNDKSIGVRINTRSIVFKFNEACNTAGISEVVFLLGVRR